MSNLRGEKKEKIMHLIKTNDSPHLTVTGHTCMWGTVKAFLCNETVEKMHM